MRLQRTYTTRSLPFPRDLLMPGPHMNETPWHAKEAPRPCESRRAPVLRTGLAREETLPPCSFPPRHSQLSIRTMWITVSRSWVTAIPPPPQKCERDTWTHNWAMPCLLCGYPPNQALMGPSMPVAGVTETPYPLPRREASLDSGTRTREIFACWGGRGGKDLTGRGSRLISHPPRLPSRKRWAQGLVPSRPPRCLVLSA
ncbi:hypothetical protein LX36DRAFT_57982 [Colletotrichum falcatum]|nr:hypothetical protein LX36DRAFT_57982 [Colletotrichum falcatum]